jgi:hypothetical protein
MERDRPLPDVIVRRAVLIAVQGDCSTRLQRDLTHPQRPTRNRVQISGQVEGLQLHGTEPIRLRE